ncbi:organic solute transporter Ostalpha-domain-containing protein, partial [Spinellus fusiger]
NSDPNVQRHKLRVLLYPPFYATLAWLSYLRYDYSTTITFFATLFEAFAVFNLYVGIQAYLAPFREEAALTKVPIDAKVMFLFNIHIKSKFGLHYRVITDMLVFQYPLWAMVDALISIISSVKGYYCPESYNLHGAHVYLVIVNFASLSLILTALFTYLAVFDEEWKRGKIKAHGMFWCVKGPIMIIFYFGELLLSGLTMAGIIHGTTGETSSDGIAWPASAVKQGIFVILVCTVMCVVSFLMARYFGPDETPAPSLDPDTKRMGVGMALVDAYLGYIPEFLYNVLCCGFDSYRLVRKRVELQARKRHE